MFDIEEETSPTFMFEIIMITAYHHWNMISTLLLIIIGFVTASRPILSRSVPSHYSSWHRGIFKDDDVNFSFSQEEYAHSSREHDVGPEDDDQVPLPEFVGQVPNVTVQIGREARLACIVKNLATYRTAWIRDEEKNILTLQRQMVTRDPRIMLQEESQMDGSDFGGRELNKIRYFVLIIRNVQFSDRGGYMCQVNTVPMKSQIGYLRVVVPPDIIDHESSNDVMVREGDNVTLKCKARGHPEPEIEWRREDGARVPLGDRNGSRRMMVNKTEGEYLEITRVTRVHSGAWLCIASNGVMPSVSRRILLNVQFAPQIWIPTEEIGAPFGSNITLDCHIEAYPLPLNYWTFGVHSESIYISGPKYEVSVKEKGYKRHLKLTIQKLTNNDLGLYKCHAQNSLGRQVKQVTIYASEIRQQTQSKQHQRIQQSITTTTNLSNGKRKMKKKRKKKKLLDNDNDQLIMTNTSNSQESTGSPNGLLYSIINSFGKTVSGGSAKTIQKERNDPVVEDEIDEEFEFYDNDDEDLEDYVSNGNDGKLNSIPRFTHNSFILFIIFLLT